MKPASLARRRCLADLGSACVVLVAAPSLAWAQSIDPATAAPAEVASTLTGARLQGQLRYRWFGLHIYDARLWSRERVTASDYAEREFALELQYARSLAGSAIAERSIDEMRKLDALSDAQAAAWLAAMRSAFPDVQAGERITGRHRPGQGASFYFNGRATREVADSEFARLFFGIWLSPRSGSASQRAALLGQPA
jgi:Chalcone isomerase-like